jgi:hypothetical protein
MLMRREATARTAWELLFGSHPARGLSRWNGLLAARDVSTAIRSRAPWAPPGVADVVQRQIASAGRHALEHIELADVCRDGWSTYRELLAAARLTRDNPGSTETVVLASHTLPAEHEVQIDVLVNEVPLTTVHLGARLELVVHSVVAEVAHGAVVALSSGSATATGTLSIARKPVLTRKRELDLSSLLRRETELPLLEQQIRLPGQTGVTTGADVNANIQRGASRGNTPVL